MRTLGQYILLGILTLPSLVSAQSIDETIGGLKGTPDNQNFGAIKSILQNFGNLAVGLVLTIALIFAIIMGYQYVTSMGNKQQTENAKKSILFIVIGIFVVLGAYLAITTVGEFFLKPEFVEKYF